ncbi:RUB1, partial [Symbiodinium sp. CCMP2456]
MASEQEEETEILEEIDEEPTEDAEAEVEEGQDAGSDGESEAEHDETVAQDEVLDKYAVVYDQSLDKVRFPPDIVAEIKRTWQLFCSNAGSPEAAGELIFNSWWAAAPSLHSYFKTPRTVLYLRIVQGIQPIVMALSHPTELKTQIDIISFRHLDRPVTAQAVEIVRDAMLDMWEAELASEFTPKARAGWFALLNYWGGAYVFYQREYAARIRIIHRSWREANKAAAQPEDEAELPAVAAQASEQPKTEEDEEAAEEKQVAEAQKQEEAGGKASNEVAKTAHDSQMKVPNSFREMFLFNAAVMG